MYISFYIDENFYSGTATAITDENGSGYLVDLNDSNKAPLQFVVRSSGTDTWKSDHAVDPDLVRAATAEINLSSEGKKEEPLVPTTYYSSEHSGGVKPEYAQGEIINEPDDVDDKTVETTR